MNKDEQAAMLLSRAEISLIGAEDQLKEKHLEEIAGELEAVNYILDSIRRETFSALYESDLVGV